MVDWEWRGEGKYGALRIVVGKAGAERKGVNNSNARSISNFHTVCISDRLVEKVFIYPEHVVWKELPTAMKFSFA